MKCPKLIRPLSAVALRVSQASLVEDLQEQVPNAGIRFLELIEQLLARLLREQSAYQCHRCGFTTRTLHWQCPGCRSWGSMLPRESSNRTS